MYAYKFVYIYANIVVIYIDMYVQLILQMANHSEHEFLAQAINIPRHVKKLLIFNSHYFHVKLLFKVKKKFWNGPDSQQNGYLLYTDITEICMCNNYAREVVCGTGTLVLGTFPQECKSSVRFHLNQLTIPSKPDTLILYLDRIGHPLPLSELCNITLHATSYCKANYQNRLKDLLPDSVWEIVHKRLIHDKVIMPPQYLEYEEYWPRLCQGHKP